MNKTVTLADHCRRIAAVGGAARSEKKAAAARANARRPRPKSVERNKLKRDEKTQQSASQAWVVG